MDMYASETYTLKHLRWARVNKQRREEYMMDLEKDRAQGLGCGFQAVGIPEKEKEPLSPAVLWTPKTHPPAPLVSGCGVLYLQS